MKVIKRDNKIVDFNTKKIYKAIMSAMESVGIRDEEVADKIATKAKVIFKSEFIHISEIETFVFFNLIQEGYENVAKSYESYRAVREYQRKENTTDNAILGLVNRTNKDVMDENSNKDAKIASTQRDLIAGEISKDIARRLLVPTNQIQAHDEGAIHIHDMDYLMQPIFNCCLINIEDMLTNGTVINGKLVEPPKSFNTACTVLTQIIAQISSNQYGGCSVTIAHIAPFLKVTHDKYLQRYQDKGYDLSTANALAKDRMMEELRDGIQTIRYQLSTLMTTNGQAPFLTIYLEIIEGSEYEYEQALICEEMIRQRLEGMKNENGQEISETFPKLVYVLDKHNCLEGGKYDHITKLSAKCNAKRLVPDYQSAKLMRKNYGGNFPPMGCRSHLSEHFVDGERKWYGRFNQGVVSLNLPQIAILSKGDMNKFWEILESRLKLCKETLLTRHKLLLGTDADTSPIHWKYGGIARLKSGETIDHLLKNGYSTISLGYVGIAEMTQAMLGVSHTTKEGEQFALEVMRTMRKACDEWKAETGLAFGLYGTPAESLIYRFCRIDRERFGEIPNVTDKLYYTNSYHVHVTEEIDAFDKLKFESQFHEISSGGCISYIEVPNMSKNLTAIEQIINYIYHNVQYAEINTKSDVCYKCGYNEMMGIDENLQWYCPNCGNNDQREMQVLRRTCGYLGSEFWNKGKTQEIKERVTHL